MAADAGHPDPTLDRLQQAIGDRYEPLERIGGGGMAEVYLARHRLHGGFCAVKVLADHLSRDDDVVARFLQEAQTAAGLEGRPNIVRIIDVGREAGLYYLIMPYVEGEDVESYLEREGRLDPAAAAYVVREIARGLSAAHQQGVVHRDLKPANVRLDPQGGVTVLDFGIAKAGGVSDLTQAGDRLGTSYYMSPEQIRGEAVDARSDLYSLGVLFYELLTGQRPFQGETHHAIEMQHVNTPGPDPAALDPSLPGELCDIVAYLMEKNPDDRYQSADAVVDVLGEFAPDRLPETLDARDDHTLDRWRTQPVRPDIDKFQAPDKPPARQGSAPPPPIAAPPPPTGSNKRTWMLIGVVLAALALVAIAVVVIPSGGDDPNVDPTAASGSSGGGSSPVDLTPPDGMVLVPAGNFRAGDPDPISPRPLHSVYLDAFFIDRTEVSNRQYQEFCNATGRPLPEDPYWQSAYIQTMPDHPVVNVSHDDAQAYAEWAGKRLPTEEEWEKAARGEDGRLYPWGMTPPTNTQANAEGRSDGFETTAPVDSYGEGEGPYGTVQQAGNVWEWTGAPYPVTPEELADMREAMKESSSDWRVLKGGSYTIQSESQFLHLYQRRGFPSNGKNPSIGFRCVQNAD